MNHFVDKAYLQKQSCLSFNNFALYLSSKKYGGLLVFIEL
jgi:hypothetical protein